MINIYKNINFIILFWWKFEFVFEWISCDTLLQCNYHILAVMSRDVYTMKQVCIHNTSILTVSLKWEKVRLRCSWIFSLFLRCSVVIQWFYLFKWYLIISVQYVYLYIYFLKWLVKMSSITGCSINLSLNMRCVFRW